MEELDKARMDDGELEQVSGGQTHYRIQMYDFTCPTCGYQLQRVWGIEGIDSKKLWCRKCRTSLWIDTAVYMGTGGHLYGEIKDYYR